VNTDQRHADGCADPFPLPLWDRQAGKLVDKFMDDAASTMKASRAAHSTSGSNLIRSTIGSWPPIRIRG
jgi:hypothetical protein